MKNKMWFGNRNYMQWVPCPEAGADYSAGGASQSMGYLHGGAFRRDSMNQHKTYRLSWALTTRDNIRTVTDFREGVYGPGPIYWLDPFNMDKNVLAQSFATPSLGAHDGPVLTGTDVRPTLVPTSANPHGYPTSTAVYAVAAATAPQALRHWVPVPPGHTAWIGAHGSASGATINVQPTSGTTPSGSPTALTLLPVTTDERFNLSVASAGNVDGIELYLGGDGTISLSGVMVQVLPNGITPEPGGFISGQGHWGCSWDGWPAKNAYSAAMDLMGLSAAFIETEPWG